MGYYWHNDKIMSRARSKPTSPKPPWTATNSAGYPAPAALAVDVVVLTVRDHRLLALALERPDGALALPGGFVGQTESPEGTATRKLNEKTGLERIYVEQLATFADPNRDPRGWIPTIAYLALVPADTEPTDVAAHWINATSHQVLAFDHEQILQAALDRVRGKLWWSNIAVGIFPGEFTLADARHVYNAIADSDYDAGTFARDIRATGLVTATGNTRQDTGGRPAALYRFTEHHPEWGAGRRKRVRT
jgi:8-oxo-dGTP diphosphatase